MKLNSNLLAAGAVLAAVGTGWSQIVIKQQPQSCTQCVGSNATFWVWATGTEPLAYQWQRNGVDLPGCTATNLCLANVQSSDATWYRVVITNFEGAVTSDWAYLTIIQSPVIYRITNNTPSVSVGASASMQAWASGSPATYQWYSGSLALPGKNSLMLTLTNVQVTDAGYYTVVASNLAGISTSSPVWLDVDPTFTKITTGAMVTDTTAYWLSQAWADVDGDGKLDVLVFTHDPAFQPIYRNNGGGTFTRLLASGLQGQTAAYEWTPVWGDYDNDGFLDLFVGDYGTTFGSGDLNRFFRNSGNNTFARITGRPPANEGGRSHGAAWGDYNRDGYLDLVVANGFSTTAPAQRNWLYQNLRNSLFSKVSNAGAATSDAGWFAAPMWVDVDDDGWSDLFLVGGGTNRLYRNLGDGTFSQITEGPLVSEFQPLWRTAAWVDFDNDGDLDAFVAAIEWAGSGLQPVALYRNDGALHFTKMTVNEIGPLADELLDAWSCTWGDYDNDGWIDLLVANGLSLSSNRKCVLYRNNGDGTFTKITSGSPVNDAGSTVSAQWVDYDQNGSLDLFAVGYNGGVPNRLYRNNGNAKNWLCVKCEGTASPRFGTGAKVRVKTTIAGKPMWQLRVIDAGGSGSSFVAHFGLGDATVVETLRIEWTSGQVQEFKNVPDRRYVTVTEPTQLAMTQPGVLKIQCWKGMAYSIEGSSDLQSWSPLATVTNFNPTAGIQWADPAAPGQTARFYRAVKQ